MPKYLITANALLACECAVEADNPEEALRKASKWDFELVGELSDWDTGDPYLVQELEPDYDEPIREWPVEDGHRIGPVLEFTDDSSNQLSLELP